MSKYCTNKKLFCTSLYSLWNCKISNYKASFWFFTRRDEYNSIL